QVPPPLPWSGAENLPEPQDEAPAERDLRREAVGERVLPGVEDDPPPGEKPPHVRVGKHADAARRAHPRMLGRERVVREEMRRRPLAAARAEDEDEIRVRARGPDAGDHVRRRRRRLDRHYAPNSATYPTFAGRLSTWSTYTCLPWV